MVRHVCLNCRDVLKTNCFLSFELDTVCRADVVTQAAASRIRWKARSHRTCERALLDTVEAAKFSAAETLMRCHR